MPRSGSWDDRTGRGTEYGEGRERGAGERDDWRGREEDPRWREGQQSQGWRGRERDDWRFGERDDWRPGERHDWRSSERDEWRGGGRDLSWEQGMEDRSGSPRHEGRGVRRDTPGERREWRGERDLRPKPWVDAEPMTRDTRGMYEWEDRGPLAWLRRRDERGGKPRGPKGYKRSDERIHEEVCERIARSGVDADEVEVKVEGGEVTLSGTVRMREDKWRLESLADDVWGVDDVHNQLRISRPQSTEAERQGTADLRH
jgi:hypothetical protein